MTEQEYIDVSNLAKLRAIDRLLRDLAFSSDSWEAHEVKHISESLEYMINDITVEIDND